MALINPTPESINDILAEAGIGRAAPSPHITTQESKKEQIKRIFEDHGIGLEDLAKETAILVKGSKSEVIQIRAIEFAAKVQGILSEMDEKSVVAPILNITVVNQNASFDSPTDLQSLLTPREVINVRSN